MKLKKVGLGILTSAVIFTLGACGSDPRKEFTDAYFSEKTEYNAGKFEMGIDNFDFSSDDEGSAYVNMFANQLEAVTLDGSYAMNEDDQTMEMEMNLNALGETLPFQFVVAKEKMYLSTSFFSGALDIAKSFQYPIDISKADLKKLEGKYIDLGEVTSELTEETKEEDVLDSSELFADEAYLKEMREVINTFDKDTFVKKGDVITHVFTKKEILKILEVTQAYAKENGDKETAKSIKEGIKTFKNDLDDMSFTMELNTKTDAAFASIMMAFADDTTEMSLTFTVKMTPQKNKEKITAPDKKNVLSTTEFEELLGAIYGSTVDDTDYSSYYDDLYGDAAADEEISDDYVDQLIEIIEEYPEEITPEYAEELRNNGPLIFNDDQMKRINDALDAALL